MQIWNLTEMIKKKKMNYHNSQSSHPGPEPDYLSTNWEKQKRSFQPSHRALELSSDLSPPFWVKWAKNRCWLQEISLKAEAELTLRGMAKPTGECNGKQKAGAYRQIKGNGEKLQALWENIKEPYYIPD